MPKTIRLRPKTQRLLDHTDTDIVERYRDYLLESPDRHLWLGKVLIDVDEVIRRRFACDTRLCLRRRGGKTKSLYSCCFDLEVQLLPTEVEVVERHLDSVLSGHPVVRRAVQGRGFWRYDDEWWKILRKRGDGSCIFLDWSPGLGHHCALHATALREGIPLDRIKPLICRMFPLFILETEDTHIITCYGPRTHRILFEDDYETMNCLHPNPHASEPAHIALRAGLEALIGPEGHRQLCAAAERILARDAENGRDRR